MLTFRLKKVTEAGGWEWNKDICSRSAVVKQPDDLVKLGRSHPRFWCLSLESGFMFMEKTWLLAGLAEAGQRRVHWCNNPFNSSSACEHPGLPSHSAKPFLLLSSYQVGHAWPQARTSGSHPVWGQQKEPLIRSSEMPPSSLLAESKQQWNRSELHFAKLVCTSCFSWFCLITAINSSIIFSEHLLCVSFRDKLVNRSSLTVCVLVTGLGLGVAWRASDWIVYINLQRGIFFFIRVDISDW